MKKSVLILFTFLSLAFQAAGEPPSDQVAGVETAAAIESSVKIFPNPAKSALTINLRLPSVSLARISLHDMLGNEVLAISENASGTFEKTLDVNHLRSGIYFVRINYNNGLNTIVRKIVVQ